MQQAQPFRVFHRLIVKWLKGAVERGNSLRIVRVVFCRIKLYSVYPTNLLNLQCSNAPQQAVVLSPRHSNVGL